MKFTLVEIGPTQWKVEGETPAYLWDQFIAKLRAEPGLKTFKSIDAPPIKMINNDVGHFVVYGKL